MVVLFVLLLPLRCTIMLSVLLLCVLGIVACEQQIAAPSYWYPATSPWSGLVAGAPKVAFAIINPDSGPSSSISTQYLEQTKTCQGNGIKVLGYVHTSYGTRSIAVVQAEIDLYYSWYAVDGIFLDEASTDCSLLSYYSKVHQAIHNQSCTSLVVLNPGTDTNACYTTVSDILCTFENTYSVYEEYNPPSWVFNYPASRFWHIVFSTPTASQMQSAVQLSSTRNVGFLYITDGQGSNPYEGLPSYWTSEISSFL